MGENFQRQFSDQYMLRLPEGMREQLKAAAKANSRSMNAEIVARLAASLEFMTVTNENSIDFVITSHDTSLMILQAKRAFERSFREGLKQAAEAMREEVVKNPEIALPLKRSASVARKPKSEHKGAK